MQEQAYHRGEREVPGAHALRKGRRHGGRKGGQPCQRQCHYTLVSDQDYLSPLLSIFFALVS